MQIPPERRNYGVSLASSSWAYDPHNMAQLRACLYAQDKELANKDHFSKSNDSRSREQ